MCYNRFQRKGLERKKNYTAGAIARYYVSTVYLYFTVGMNFNRSDYIGQNSASNNL